MGDSRERARRVLADAGLPPDALSGVRPWAAAPTTPSRRSSCPTVPATS
ncbi:hypothetical protein ACFQV4_24230 [Streptomyces thermocarboxydus]